jgi:mannose-6-phosphate isomerase-like protein (cupin superfamily)
MADNPCANLFTEGRGATGIFANETLRYYVDIGYSQEAPPSQVYGPSGPRVTPGARVRRDLAQRFIMGEESDNGAAMRKINIKQSLDTFTDMWSPKIVGEVNDSYVKLVKFQGEFVWHHHDAEDEMFLVVKGRMLMKLRDAEDITVEEGEFIIIPRGVEHMPVADEEAHVLLFEPRSTLNTGNVRNERTVAELERL